MPTSRGRPKTVHPINCQRLREACLVAYPDQKLTAVYRRLASEFCCSVRTVRNAFAGEASDHLRESLERHFGLDDEALSLRYESPKKLIEQIRESRLQLDEHVRHHTEQTFSQQSTAMMALTPLILEALQFVGTSDLPLDEQLEILDIVEWHVAYRHLVEDSPENEQRILELLRPAIDCARNLLEQRQLSEHEYAHVHSLVGEFCHNWVPPSGDIWKRDSFTRSEADRATYFHRQAALHFQEAAKWSPDDDFRRQSTWRQFIEVECQARLYAKAGDKRAANECLEGLEPLAEQLEGDDLVLADLSAVRSLIETNVGELKLAAKHARTAIDLYSEHLGSEHHLPLSIILMLNKNPNGKPPDDELDRAVTFFRTSSLKAHWMIDLQKTMTELLEADT